MELPKEYGKAIGAVLTRLKRASLAEALRKATLIYGMSRNGNGLDDESKTDGRAEADTATKRVWIEKAILPTKPGEPEQTTWHFGVNPINARSIHDVCVSLIHAAILAEVSTKVEENKANRLRLYGQEFTESAAGIIQHWPDGSPKPEGRVRGRETFHATKALTAELATIIPSLPPLPFRYEAAGRATEPVNLLVSVKRDVPRADPSKAIVYRAPATWPDRGKDEADKAANLEAALTAYDNIKADGMILHVITVDDKADAKVQARQRERMLTDVTTIWATKLQPYLDMRAEGTKPEAKAESERKVG
jgi:hypothetical protein